MYIEEVKKPSTADCFKDGMKLRSVEEKFLKLGLCCKTWDSWLDELYLLGKTSHLIFSIFSFIRREHFAAIKVRLLSEMTVVFVFTFSVCLLFVLCGFFSVHKIFISL